MVLTLYSNTDNMCLTKYVKALMRKSNYMLEIKRGNTGGNFP